MDTISVIEDPLLKKDLCRDHFLREEVLQKILVLRLALMTNPFHHMNKVSGKYPPGKRPAFSTQRICVYNDH